MRTPVRFWGYLEGNSLNINEGDILIRMSEYRTFLKAIETKSAEAVLIYPNSCFLYILHHTVTVTIQYNTVTINTLN